MLEKFNSYYGVVLDHNKVGSYIDVTEPESGATEIVFAKGYFMTGLQVLCSIVKPSNESHRAMAVVETVLY